MARGGTGTRLDSGPMPELPEVETIVRDIRPSLLGRRFGRVTLSHDDVLRGERADGGASGAELHGEGVGAVGFSVTYEARPFTTFFAGPSTR